MAQIPQFTPVEKLTLETVQAAYELIAEALLQKSAVLMIHLADVTYEGMPIDQ